MRRRESVLSYTQLSSRFSTSTQGSRISQPPPVPDKGDTEDLPRVSLSTDDGRSVDLHIDSVDVRKDTVPHLPPIPFPSAPLSEFIDDVTNNSTEETEVEGHVNQLETPKLHDGTP
jgi:mitogen-activated protein kinase kinase kinase